MSSIITRDNPLLKKRINISDLKAGIQQIHNESRAVLEVIEDHESTNSDNSEMQVVMQASGLEILMTKIAREFRESFL